MFKSAVLANAAALLTAHTQTSGNPEPSREDVAVTKQLVEAGRVMGIPVHDHLILAGGGYTSLAERGVMVPQTTAARGRSLPDCGAGVVAHTRNGEVPLDNRGPP